MGIAEILSGTSLLAKIVFSDSRTRFGTRAELPEEGPRNEAIVSHAQRVDAPGHRQRLVGQEGD